MRVALFALIILLCHVKDFMLCTLLYRLPAIDIEVPSYELPLPEGIGDDKFQQEHMSVREIEESWREKLHEIPSTSSS